MIDPFALRLREATIVAGIWLTCCVGALGEVYVGLTWQEPNRTELAVLFAMAIALGAVVSLLPRERIVRSRYRELFFLGWTCMDFVLIVLGALADGGTASPIVLIFFMPVVFSSMSYPLTSVVIVGVLSILCYVGLALTTGGSSAVYQGGFVAALGLTGLMSAWQARNHNRQHDALAEMSRADPLTGCLNRRGFEERAVAELETMKRRAHCGAVMVLDIDHFKPINDELGHAAGDELLCWVVGTLERVVRPIDAVGRLGGDEFAVLFGEIEPGDALRSAARIRAALSERAPCSIGVAVFPDDGTALEDLTRQADARLYASRGGRQASDALGPIAPRQLAQSRDYARAVAECMGEGLFTLDVGGRVTYLNPVAEALLGWPEDELLGRVMHQVIHRRRPNGSVLPFEDCPITGALRERETVRIEDDLFITRSGRELPVAYTATPFATADGLQGCVVVFRDVSERRRLEAEQRHDVETLACIDRVKAALSEERLVLHAQPIIDLRTGETVQHELLLRMRERDGEIVTPASFLDVAEQYSLVGEIDRWVIERASQIAADGSPVELNISARSIGDVAVLQHIERSIEQTGADPARLVFEITETAIVEDQAAARAFATRLRLLGCRLALDDFGTGYGGFTYLKQIPIDYLKIDIEFVRDLLSNRASRHVVQAVVALARDFAVETVAEGVEDGRTLDLLREMGVDFAQGYHIARPQPFDLAPGDRSTVVSLPARGAGGAPRRAARSRRSSTATHRAAAEESRG